METYKSEIKVKNGIEFKKSSFYDCFINLYTVDKNDKLNCNGCRIRTEKQLRSLQSFIETKIIHYELIFDALLGINKGLFGYLGVRASNYSKIVNTLKYIAFYKHLLERVTIYVCKEENIWYVNKLKKNYENIQKF